MERKEQQVAHPWGVLDARRVTNNVIVVHGKFSRSTEIFQPCDGSSRAGVDPWWRLACEHVIAPERTRHTRQCKSRKEVAEW